MEKGLRTLIEGRRIGTVYEGARRTPLIIRSGEGLRTSPAALANLLLTLADGRKVPLSILARIERIEGPVMVNRERASRTAVTIANKEKFGLSDDTKVVSCYEAGRDGFWLHRYLVSLGIENQVVDSSSLETNRRKRRAKTDRIDGVKLLTMLMRYWGGERGLGSVVRVPSGEDEEARRLPRELASCRRSAPVLAIGSVVCWSPRGCAWNLIAIFSSVWRR